MATFGSVQLPSPATPPSRPLIRTDHSSTPMHASALYLCSHSRTQDVSSRYKVRVLLLYMLSDVGTLATSHRAMLFLGRREMLFCCDENGMACWVVFEICRCGASKVWLDGRSCGVRRFQKRTGQGYSSRRRAGWNCNGEADYRGR